MVHGVGTALALVAGLGSLAPAHAQTTTCFGREIQTLNFQNPVLESGTGLLAGAVYRFSNVSNGIDALVTINALTNATLAIIDRDTGLIPNFQPELAGSGARSVDFTITLVNAGTTTPVAIDFVATGIDIDGDGVSLREYSEFSRPFSAYVLDANTNLAVDASGPSVPTNARFESVTAANAVGIDPNATQNIAAIVYTGTSSFNYRIGALGTGATTRLTSLDFGCPALALPAPTQVAPQDFGDAPASYGDPAHDIVGGVQIGATNTSEATGYNNANASADGGDDGVAFGGLIRGASATVSVSVQGAGGRLQAWIDYNGNGTFNDAGERIATNVRDNGTGDGDPTAGVIRLTFTIPSSATLAQTFARFRWSTQAGLGPSLTAPSGEVEDYAVTFEQLPSIVLSKTSAVYDPGNAGLFLVPGNEVVYTITATNNGPGITTANSIFVVDRLPAQVTFFNGDFDDAGPGTAAIAFTQVGSGLTFTPSTDLRYATGSTPPANFAACTYSPTAGYDANVRYICLNPKGVLQTAATAPAFTAQFRARIR
ncbi:MAG: GEVED domain-containing protein [Sphingomonas sp.]